MSYSSNPYVNNTINSILPYVSGAPTDFTQTNPFTNYFNAQGTKQAVENQFAPYYQQVLNNYLQQANLNSSKYLNEYNNSLNYLSGTQQNFLNYHNARSQYQQSQLMGGFQGKGAGDSSGAQNAGYDLANQNNYALNQQNLDYQNQLKSAQDLYNYNNQANDIATQGYEFNQNQAQQKDVMSAYSQQYQNAQQQYQNILNNYYSGQNYINSNPSSNSSDNQNYINSLTNSTKNQLNAGYQSPY